MPYVTYSYSIGCSVIEGAGRFLRAFWQTVAHVVPLYRHIGGHALNKTAPSVSTTAT